MTRARLSLALTGACLAALTLTGCEKPAPSATVFSGTTSTYREAACWAFDDTSIDANACAQDVLEKAASGATVGTVPIFPGDVIGISVDPAVADAGWTPRIGGQSLTQEPLTTTYFRFTYPDLQPISTDGLSLEIVAGDAASTKGIWLFQIVPA